MRHTIPVLDKALRVILALTEKGTAGTQSELSGRLGISPSTCYRILQTLIAHHWIRPADGGGHAFSAGLLPLLEPLSDFQKMFQHLEEPLRTIVAESGLTAKISVRLGLQAVTVFRVESDRGLAPNSKIGASFPLAYGSSGACFLAECEDAEIRRILADSPPEVWRLQKEDDVWTRIHAVRKSGTCYDPGQFQSPVHGVSASIKTSAGSLLAVATLVGWPDDFAGRKKALRQSQIKNCARQVSGC